MQDVIVIGAGPAGCAAAVQLVRLGVKPLVIDQTGRCGGLIGNAYRVENCPATGGPITGKEFARRLQAHVDSFRVPVEQDRVRVVIDYGRDFAVLCDGLQEGARAVIFACGTAADAAGISGEEKLAGSRVFYEVRDVLERAPRRVLVVGGGEAAFDYALSLAAHGVAVDVCVRGERPDAGARLESLAKRRKRIRVCTRTRIVGLAGTADGVRATVKGPGGKETEEADAVLIAVGRSSAVPTIQRTGGRSLVRVSWPRGTFGRGRPAWRRAVGTGSEPQPDRPAGSKRPDACRTVGIGKNEWMPGCGEMGLTIGPGLYIAGDARLGGLGQASSAIGDGLLAAALAVEFLRRGA